MTHQEIIETEYEQIDGTLLINQREITNMETLLSNPNQLSDTKQVATLGDQYQALQNKSKCLWEKWERLSSEAEEIDIQLRNLNRVE